MGGRDPNIWAVTCYLPGCVSGGSSVESRGAAVQTRSSDLGYGSRIWYPKPSLDHCSNVCPRFLTHFFFFLVLFLLLNCRSSLNILGSRLGLLIADLFANICFPICCLSFCPLHSLWLRGLILTWFYKTRVFNVLTRISNFVYLLICLLRSRERERWIAAVH